MVEFAEIFLNNHCVNSGADVMARDSAIAVSIALQLGADLETLRAAMSRDTRGGVASGPLGVVLDHIKNSAEENQRTEDERKEEV